jgi:hypothetical protein
MSAPIGEEYSAHQLKRALDAAERGETDQERVQRWQAVVDGLLSGHLAVGTRTPVSRYPEWVTLDVVTGGFATGASLAAGPWLPHETTLLAELGLQDTESPRLALNRYFLSDVGLNRLSQAVESRQFVIDVAAEAALPTVAWLAAHGQEDVAMHLVEILVPFFHELRFYPQLNVAQPVSDGLVHLEPTGVVVKRLRETKPNTRVLAQREAIGIWTPLYDAAISLILETVDGDLPIAERDEHGGWLRSDLGRFVVTGGWPFKRLSSDWVARARSLLDEVDLAKSHRSLCKRFSREGEPFMVLVGALNQAANAPEQLTARHVGRVRLILARYVAKRGGPMSKVATTHREKQNGHATQKTHQEIALEVADRLAMYPPLTGLDDLDAVLQASVNQQWPQSEQPRVPPGVLRRLQRCMNDSPEGLIQRGVVSSGEVLAKLLPQRTSQLRAANFGDMSLRVLYAATYRAFRRRRSLLLLNLQKQVQISDLPWVAAMDRFRDADKAASNSASDALEEFASIAIAHFPQTIVPNKLLQEFSALAEQAGKRLPFTEELAADIFMGRFSPKFVEAVHIAAVHLRGSLYESYYRLDYRDIATRLSAAGTDRAAPDTLAAICAERAGESLGTWKAASNGRIIEQQLVITSHNLAALFELRGVHDRLADRAVDLAGRCYAWTLSHLQLPLKEGDWRTELHRIKNAAYAWRQMVFLLSLRPSEAPAFLTHADALLNHQTGSFSQRFRPAVQGLRMALETPEVWAADSQSTPFLGWKDTHRWRVQSGL